MVYTVLGEMESKEMGLTLTHEHIVWSDDGLKGDPYADTPYHMEDVLDKMLPNLLALRQAGCSTFVDATPPGCGRNVSVLKECSIRSGLNIITNTGAFLDYNGRYVYQEIHEKDQDYIADKWSKEFSEGIQGTDIKPGFIKIALSTNETLSDLEEKVVRAAAKASLSTGIPIECHVAYAVKARKAVDIVEQEKLSPARFVWVHADAENELTTMVELAERGVWLEIDSWARGRRYEATADTLKKLMDKGLQTHLLLSQDAGIYGYLDAPIFPYTPVFNEFLPFGMDSGIPKDVFDQILMNNPAKLFERE